VPLPARRRHGLVEDELTVLDAVDAVVGERRVAVLVDVVRAEHRLTVLRVEQRVDHRLPVAAPLAQLVAGVEDQVHGLVAVDGIRVGVLLAVAAQPAPRRAGV
jgi:hypothetical protein